MNNRFYCGTLATQDATIRLCVRRHLARTGGRVQAVKYPECAACNRARRMAEAHPYLAEQMDSKDKQRPPVDTRARIKRDLDSVYLSSIRRTVDEQMGGYGATEWPA